MVKVEVYLSQSPQFAIQANPYFFRNLKNVLVARPDGGHGFSLGWGWWDAALGWREWVMMWREGFRTWYQSRLTPFWFRMKSPGLVLKASSWRSRARWLQRPRLKNWVSFFEHSPRHVFLSSSNYAFSSDSVGQKKQRFSFEHCFLKAIFSKMHILKVRIGLPTNLRVIPT